MNFIYLHSKNEYMLITLSPAKVLDFKTPILINKSSSPIFQNESKELNDILKNLSPQDISRLMKLNPKQTMEVFQYIQAFELRKTPHRQAIFTYNGIAYQGFDASTLSVKDLNFAQKHLVILSGLYGVLRPLDAIKPYRLEMQAGLGNPRGKTLYNYWSECITSYISNQMKADDNVWVNLSSSEYSKVINRKKLPKGHKIITPVFKEQKGNSYKQVTVYAKKARGMMARFIVENQLTDVENIKAFDTENYCFSSQLSNTNEWVFIR